jgi:hypothetical protein
MQKHKEKMKIHSWRNGRSKLISQYIALTGEFLKKKFGKYVIH